MRAHFFVLITCAIVPLAVLPMVMSWLERKHSDEHGRRELEWATEVGSRDLSRLFLVSDDFIRAIADRAESLASETGNCGQVLPALVTSLPFFSNIALFADDGRILCSTTNVPPGVKAADPDLFAFMRRLGSHQPAITDYRVGRISDGPVLTITYSVPGPKRRYILASVDVRWLRQQVAKFALPQHAAVILFDRKGTVVARAGEQLPAEGKQFFDDKVVKRMSAQKTWTGTVEGADGTARQFSFGTAADGLYVAYGIPVSVLHARSDAQLALSLLVVAFTSVLVFAMVWLGASTLLLNPLKAVSQAAARVSQGDYSARLGQPAATELAELARAFDGMTASLEQANAKTAKAAAALRSLVAGTSGEEGAAFFESFVIHLAKIIEVRYALIGELVGETVVRTLAIADNGTILQNFSQPLSNTPCEQVLKTGFHKITSSAAANSPEGSMLRRLEADSYMGSLLLDRAGKAVGVVVVLDTKPLPEDTAVDALDVLKLFSARAALELERQHAKAALEQSQIERDLAFKRTTTLVQQLKMLTARREKIREQERTRMAREIHDELGQQLTLLKFEQARITRAVQSGQDASALLAECPLLIDQAIATVRRIATELRPGILDNFGLAATLEWHGQEFSKRTGIACEFMQLDDVHLDPNAATALFRVFQEALTNVARHSGATQVNASLRKVGPCAVLEVSDNGSGVNEHVLGSPISTGLLGMQERAEMLGGWFSIANNADQGARVVVSVPLQGSAELQTGVSA